MASGQSWGISADGGYMANPKLSKKLRFSTQPLLKFRQFVRPIDAFGKNVGDTVDYNKVTNVQTAGRKISETEKMPETKFIIRRASMSVSEWGNSIPYTGKLSDLSSFDITNPVHKGLRDDMAKVLDSGVATVAKTTDLSYTPTGVAVGDLQTDGSPASGGVNFNLFHLKEIVDYAVENNIPPATGGEGGDYVLIGTQKLIRGILDDPEFQEWTKYTQADRLLNGEVGKVYRTRIVLTTNTGALAKKNSSALGEGMFLGDDALVEAVAVSEEIRAKVPDDYGRSKGVAWYMLGDFATPWDFSVDGEGRIIYITSSSA